MDEWSVRVEINFHGAGTVAQSKSSTGRTIQAKGDTPIPLPGHSVRQLTTADAGIQYRAWVRRRATRSTPGTTRNGAVAATEKYGARYALSDTHDQTGVRCLGNVRNTTQADRVRLQSTTSMARTTCARHTRAAQRSPDSHPVAPMFFRFIDVGVALRLHAGIQYPFSALDPGVVRVPMVRNL